MVGRIITYVAVSKSAETLRRLEELVKRQTDPDGTIAKVSMCYPAGVEKVTVKEHRIGDYFEKIELLHEDSADNLSVKVVFHVRQGVDSYWKDMMFRILRTGCEGLTGLTVRLVPDWT